MGLETGTYIDDLVATNPLGSDDKSQGDNHLRLIKSVLQATFPSADRAITLTQKAEWSDVVSSEASSRVLVTADLGKILLGDTTGGAVTLTLPDPSVVLTGWGGILKRKIAGTNALTLKRFGAELIDGVARDITLDIINDTVTFETDGTDWYISSSHLYGESRLVTGGAADVYTIALGRNVAAYYDGLTVKCEVHATNTGATTFNADAIGADAIEWPDGSALIAGDLPIGAKVTLIHDGANWQLMTVTRPLREFLDEDDMVSDSAISTSSQQAIKAHVAAEIATAIAALTQGKILQTQITVDTTNRETGSGSFVGTGVSVSITPSSTSSKIRIRAYGLGSGNTAIIGPSFTVFRDAVDLTPSGVNGLAQIRIAVQQEAYNWAFEVEDSPSSTSALSYEIYWKTPNGTIRLGRRYLDTLIDAPTIIVVEEIGA